jgi:hypothetical protein
MLTIGDMTVLEGNTGVQNALVTVNLTEPHGNSVTVNYSTVDGSAKAASDYNAVSGKLTFAKNEMSKSISIPIRGDRVVEPDEYFSVRLSNAKGAKIADDMGFVTIMDNEPRVSISDASQLEGNTGTTSFQFAVTLSTPYDMPVTVHYATRDDSATAPGDYQADAGTLTLGPNDSSPKLITIAVVGDKVPELDKTFFVDVTTSDSYAAIRRGTAVGTIWDDEPRIFISDAYNYGESTISFTVSVSNLNPGDDPVTVDFATVNGTAIGGDGSADWDYIATWGTLTFDSATTTQTITVQVNNLTFLYDKYFNIHLTNASPNALLVNEWATGYAYYDYYYYDPGCCYYDPGYWYY